MMIMKMIMEEILMISGTNICHLNRGGGGGWGW